MGNKMKKKCHYQCASIEYTSKALCYNLQFQYLLCTEKSCPLHQVRHQSTKIRGLTIKSSCHMSHLVNNCIFFFRE